MKKIINKIKYKIKRSVFDLVFNVEGKKMSKSLVSSLINEWQQLAVRFNPKGALKIRPYVSEYLIKCLTSGQPVDILIQWCVTKMLDERKKLQGGKLEIQPDESKFFNEDLPRIFSILSRWGLKINFIITFNRSEFERSRASSETELEYKKIIYQLAEESKLDILLIDAEEFFGQEKIEPNKELLKNFDLYIKPGKLQFELERGKKLMAAYGYQLSDEEILQSTKIKLAIMAEEGRILCQDIFPEGFILIPIENPERYDFFDILIKDFKDRLAPIVRRYPWRYKELY